MITTTELFLIAMGVICSLPYLIWRVGRTDYWAPLVVVQILTAILLGPARLGAAFRASIRHSSMRKWCRR